VPQKIHCLNYHATYYYTTEQCCYPKCEVNNKQFSPIKMFPNTSLIFLVNIMTFPGFLDKFF